MKMGIAILLFLLFGKPVGFAEPIRKVDEPNNNRVLIVTLDGFRWQELFKGADPHLLTEALRQPENKDLEQFTGERAQVRRQRLMPFLWSVVAAKGQMLGNRTLGSKINVTNPYVLSYAGYNELFTGRTDHLIWSNRKRKNANRTIFEYLNRMPHFRGKVASFASWDAFPFILNAERSRIWVNTGDGHDMEDGVRPDTATFAAARNYLLKHRPKVLHLGLGGTDEAGHRKQYGNYLRQAHLADRLIATFWGMLQSLPEYRDNTSLIITTDHGRGSGRHNWHKHGTFVPGSSQTWMALMGKGIKSGGESRRKEQLYGTQVAGTIGYLLQVNSYRAYTIPATLFTFTGTGGDIVNKK